MVSENFVTISVVWPVDLKRHEDGVWLQKGWPEFARYYCIQFGYMLVFEYQPHSADFHVLIFDTSSTEIDYPISTKSGSGKSSQVSKRFNEMDVLTKPPKKTKPNVATKNASHIGVCLMPKSEQVETKEYSESAIDEEVNYKGRALASAQTFRSSFPFFVIAMTRSHVDGRHGMNVPKTFEKSYKNWNNNDQVNLQIEGKSWLVKFDMKQNRHRLSIGRDTFARENSLNVDDVCVFERIDAPKKLFHVFHTSSKKKRKLQLVSHYDHFRIKYMFLVLFIKLFTLKHSVSCDCFSGNGNNRLPRVRSEAENAAVLTSANAFKSKNPFFTIKMQPSYVHGGSVNLPSKYITKDHRGNVILRVSGGRAWSVTCSTYGSSIVKFTSGWKKFVQENNLAAGDVCVFEQINCSKKLFNVVVFRARSSELK